MKMNKNFGYASQDKSVVEKKKLPFIQLPNDILCHKALSDEACRTLCVLLTFKIGKNSTFPSLKAISLLRGRTINSISIHIKELKELGIISYKKRGYSQSNEYFFNFTIGCDNGFSKTNNITADNDSISPPVDNAYPSQQYPNNTNSNIETKDIDVCSPEERQKHMDEIRNQLDWLKQKSNVKVII